MSIEEVAQLRWNRRQVPIKGFRVTPGCRNTISLIMKNIGINSVVNSRERFLNFRKIVSVDGKIPAPVVLVLKQGLHGILDGNHRIAAMASMENRDRLFLDSWVGE